MTPVIGISLGIQWLTLHLEDCISNAGSVDLIPGWGFKILHATQCGPRLPQKKSSFVLSVFILQSLCLSEHPCSLYPYSGTF